MKRPNIFSFAGLNVALRSAVYFSGQTLSTILLGPVMLLLSPLGLKALQSIALAWVRFNLWTLRIVCGLDFEVEGRENIPARAGVVFCKHQSAWETLALQIFFPSSAFILKRELLRIPVWGWAMATLKPIAIDRSAKSHAMKQVLRDGLERLEQGRWVILFPEGTRVAPGQRGRYAASGGMLAHKAGCPLVPVAHNAGEYWAKNGFLKYPGRIKLRIGPALDGQQLGTAELNRQAEDWIESRMSEITGVSYSEGSEPRSEPPLSAEET